MQNKKLQKIRVIRDIYTYKLRKEHIEKYERMEGETLRAWNFDMKKFKRLLWYMIEWKGSAIGRHEFAELMKTGMVSYPGECMGPSSAYQQIKRKLREMERR